MISVWGAAWMAEGWLVDIFLFAHITERADVGNGE
jgi:hypothetical protein